MQHSIESSVRTKKLNGIGLAMFILMSGGVWVPMLFILWGLLAVVMGG